MSAENLPEMPPLTADNLFRQETFTDLKVGTIQRLTPVKADGSVDESRNERFVASTSIMSPHGAVPVQADIEAKDLKEAVEKFPAAVKAGVEKMVEDARELERQMRSGIVVPKGNMDVSGMGGGGAPGGGIALP